MHDWSCRVSSRVQHHVPFHPIQGIWEPTHRHRVATGKEMQPERLRDATRKRSEASTPDPSRGEPGSADARPRGHRADHEGIRGSPSPNPDPIAAAHRRSPGPTPFSRQPHEAEAGMRTPLRRVVTAALTASRNIPRPPMSGRVHGRLRDVGGMGSLPNPDASSPGPPNPRESRCPSRSPPSGDP